jgi:GxxExxY protein
MGKMEKWGQEDLTDKIIRACIEVHKELGPGFLENIYQNALKIELEKRQLAIESEREVKVRYCGIDVGIHKVDIFVEDEIVVELKAVEDLNKKYYAQVRSYLKALNKEVGLLVNFAAFTLDVRRVELVRKTSGKGKGNFARM